MSAHIPHEPLLTLANFAKSLIIFEKVVGSAVIMICLVWKIMS